MDHHTRGKKTARLTALFGVLSLTTGCATIMTGTTESVSINSDPLGARVELSNGMTCVTPCTVEVAKKDSLQVTLRKDGCNTHTTALIPTLSGTGVILYGFFMRGIHLLRNNHKVLNVDRPHEGSRRGL